VALVTLPTVRADEAMTISEAKNVRKLVEDNAGKFQKGIGRPAHFVVNFRL